MSGFLRTFDRSLGDPYLGWDELFRGFDRVFREMDRDLPLTSFGRAASSLAEEGDRFVLRVDVPGLTEKDVQVDFQGGALTVSAQRTTDAPEGYTPVRRERSAIKFSRSFVLGDHVDPEKTTAEIKDGVLTVSLAKSQAVQKRTIPIVAS